MIHLALLLAALIVGGPAARPPRVVPPRSITTEARGPAGTVVRYPRAKAVGARSITYSRRSGSVFPLGSTTVTVAAHYAGKRTARARFTVTVVDTTPPLLGPPANITTEATGTTTAVPYTAPTAQDRVDGATASTCSPGPGAAFPLGTTTVTCAAADRAGNRVSVTFQVQVVDTTPPVLAAVSDVSVAESASVGTRVTYTVPAATDRADPHPAVACSPASGAVFPVGTTTVTCTATDAAGNHATTSFRVFVTVPLAARCTPDSFTAPGAVPISTAQPGLQVVTDPIHYYEIYGNTTGEVAAQMSQCTPVSGFAGWASWYVDWTYSVGSVGGLCQVTAATVGLHLAEVLPAWTPGPLAAADIAPKWQTFVANLHTHEQGHLDLATTGAQKILSDLLAVPAAACDQIGTAANAAAQSAMSALTASEAAYDDTTNHGVTQGAIFP